MNHEPLHLDLFSGIGGFSLAFEAAGFRTIAFCEFDPDRQRDLRHHWPGVPIVGDINDIDAICRVVADAPRGGQKGSAGGIGHDQRTGASGSAIGAGCECKFIQLDRNPLILTAGVPCQPASAAGKRKGSADDRWLWPQTLRVVERVRPDWCVFENPLGIASLAQPAAIPGVDIERLRDVPGRTICEILTAIRLLGYELPTDRDGVPWIPVMPAAGVGAFHGRDRLWIIARRGDVGDSNNSRLQGHRNNGECAREWTIGAASPEPCVTVGNADEIRLPMREHKSGAERTGDNASIGTCPTKTKQGPLPNWSDAILERGQDGKWRAVKPGLRLLASGVPRRTSKLRGLGNSICPQVAYQIAKSIREQMI